jgi:SpoIID/LytB domain protein
MRARVTAFVAAVAILVPAVPARASVPVLTVTGKGWGHGVGLSQEGAHAMANAGASLGDILGRFYPGTAMGTASGEVRVVVHSVPSETLLDFPQGGEVRSSRAGAQAAGFPVRFGPGGRVRIRHDSAYHVEVIGTVSGQALGKAVPYRAQVLPPIITTTTTQPGSTTTTTRLLPQVSTTTTTTAPAPSPSSPTTRPAPGTTATSAPPGGGGQPPPTPAPPPPPPQGPVVASSSSPSPVWAVPVAGGTTSVPERGRRYRGVMEATASAGPLRLVNQLDVEDYLRGMGEVRDPSWPQPALMAQAVVARTYAMRGMQYGELCDYVRCQVYLGQQAEYGAMDQAVANSRGQVVTYNGRLASTVYSANGGGISATTLEGFGTPDGTYPYLRATRYRSENPFPWKTAVALSDLGGRFGYDGTVGAVKITKRGRSGRALEVTLSGDHGKLAVPGREFASGLALRSTLFKVRVGEADKAPPPPKRRELIQALPDDEEALEKASLDTEQSLERKARAAALPNDDDDGPGTAAWLGVLALGAATAVGMSRFGPVPALLRDPGTPDVLEPRRKRLRIL